MYGARIASTDQLNHRIMRVDSIWNSRTANVHANVMMDGIRGIREMIGIVLTGNLKARFNERKEISKCLIMKS